MTEFCVCVKDDGLFRVCVVSPLGNLTVMLLGRERFEDLRNKMNACNGRLLSAEIPKCVRKAFGEGK